ncbi:MAG TPA: chemotaxis protein CheB [Polyangium sp.]|nr:chemotaxis protein CheB [Polyangium sp.]
MTTNREDAGDKPDDQTPPDAQPDAVQQPDNALPQGVTQVFPVVAIGASAGGIAALKTFFRHVPEDSGVAFVVVVHLSPEHESHLQEILQPNLKVRVQQVTETVRLEKNHAYIIPPNFNLDAIDTHLRLSHLEKRRHDRAPIDHFFRTLAETHGKRAIGVILTGTGSDGSLGLRHIKEHGGLAIVQDPSEAEYLDMPQNAIKTGSVDMVLPLAKIPQAIFRYFRTSSKLEVRLHNDDDDEETSAKTSDEDKRFLKKVFAIIQSRTGRDFNQYKLSTMQRRVARRMQLHHIRVPSAYLELLARTPEEIAALADDLLINVTSFFRDPEVFETLEKLVIPQLFDGKGPGDNVRVWSVGCATGEEAYSLAILLLEKATQLETPPAIQVFASDLHKQALERAREGIYTADIQKNVRPDRLERFFTRENGNFRVKREVRELIVFAPHNVIADPPYSRLDLISCRNLFIYLDRELHRRIVEIFHYALRPDGHLLLGTSENIEESDLFRVEDKKRSLFRRSSAVVFEPRLPVFNLGRSRMSDRLPATGYTPEAIAYGSIHQRLAEQYAPPSVLLSPDNHVVHFSARAGRYFVHPGGSPTTSVFKLVRDDLRVELKTAVSTARAQNQVVRTRPIDVRFDGTQFPIVLDLRPSLDPEHPGFMLLIFDETPPTESPKLAELGQEDRANAVELARIQDLLQDKERAERRLQEIIKDYETSQEDLRASNEELQSANEELRSTFEELETSKEELQSINEELQTVNQENRHKMEELAQLSSDLQNLFAAADIATIFLDREFRILRFTPKTTELFNVQLTDRGRYLSDFTHRLGHTSLIHDARNVLERLIPIEREVEDSAGRWYMMRIRPYRGTGDRIAGVVLTFIEITQRKQTEDALRGAKEYSEHIIETLPQPLLVLSEDFVVKRANAAFYTHFRVGPDQTRGRKVFELGNDQWNIPALRDLLERVLPDNKTFTGYTVEHVFEGLGKRVMLLNGRQLAHMRLILLGINDITERYEVENALRVNEERLRRMMNVEGVGVLTFDRTGTLIDANDAFLRMVGRSREEITQRMLTWQNMTGPEHIELSQRQLDKLQKTGRLGPYEKEYIHKDGSLSWMVFAGADMGDGTIVQYCIDVSDRKRAEAALHDAQARLGSDLQAMSTLQKLGSLFIAEGNLDSILHQIVEAAVAIAAADFAAIQIFDPNTKQLGILAQRGFEPWWVEHCNKVQDQCASRRALENGERIIIEDVETDPILAGTDELEMQRRAGVRALQATPLVSRSGRPLGVFSTHTKKPGRPSERTLQLLDLLARQASDIVDRAQAEEAREAHLQLVDADRRKNEFLAMLSHELRNPLTPILTSLHILDIAEPGSEKARKAKAVIGRQVSHLTHLIEDLLDVTRITSGKVQFEILDMNELVQRVVADHRDVFAAQGLGLELQQAPTPVWVHGDKTRLSQVIGNILQNAAKFTSRGGKAVVVVENQAAQQQAIVRILDTGRGIAPEMLPRLFEPFTQADASLDRAKGGLGLGLAVVKGLVELHGGSVRGESDGQGKGAVFTVVLPSVTAPVTTTAPQAETNRSR